MAFGYFGPHGGGIAPSPIAAFPPLSPDLSAVPSSDVLSTQTYAPDFARLADVSATPPQPQAYPPHNPDLSAIPSPNTASPYAAQSSPAGHSIEAVIANLGIHPHSGLASAMRAIHAVLTAHLAAQAVNGPRGQAMAGALHPFAPHPTSPIAGPVRPGPALL